MENDIDIDIEEVSRINKEKEQNLRKLKMNIERLQKNMAKKQQKSKPALQISRQPTSIYNQLQKQYSSTSPISTEKQFAFNSTLFKNINNESQPIMENPSGVSNFSSVSNINNLLNAHNKPQMMNSNYNPSIRSPLQNNLLSDIDKLLKREPKTFSIGFPKIADVRQSQQNSDLSNSRQLNSSKSFLQKSGGVITPQLDQFRKLIDNLESIHERSKAQTTHRKLAQTGQNLSKDWQREEQQQLASSIDIKQDYRRHHKNQTSNLAQKSDYSQNYSKLPPLPSSKAFVPPNTVQRNKAKLKESLQQFKKLSTQMINENLQKSEIELVFSDQDSEEQRRNKDQQIQKLMKQRKDLCQQLARIDRQLQQLESNE